MAVAVRVVATAAGSAEEATEAVARAERSGTAATAAAVRGAAMVAEERVAVKVAGVCPPAGDVRFGSEKRLLVTPCAATTHSARRS